jgi:putative phosphotransacetylase
MLTSRIPITLTPSYITLSKHDQEQLFGKGYIFNKQKDLPQPQNYSTTTTCKIIWPQGELVLPIYHIWSTSTQVQISRTEWEKLWLSYSEYYPNDLSWASDITIVWSKKSKYIHNCTFTPLPYIHCSQADADQFQLKQNQIINITLPHSSQSIENIKVLIRDHTTLNLHLHSSRIEKWFSHNSRWIIK